ncbi:MAG: gshB [Burkholderiales bacterium]|jgi:glutathione synthase|nr:gshB [Burkholderiales bacterium]
MKILFICDPVANFKIHGDSTIALMAAAKDLGYSVHYALPKDIFATNNKALANSIPIEILIKTSDLNTIAIPWYTEHKKLSNCDLANYDAVMVRNDPPFDMEYYYLTQILELAENKGAKVVNNSYALRNFNEKLSILNFPEYISPTLVSRDKAVILNFIEEHGDCVVKPLDQMAGRGVFKLSENDANLSAILELSTNYFNISVMVQKFIPEVIYGDRRVFIVDGKIISHCLHRIPQGNQIRGNLAAGGRGEVHPVAEKDYIIANDVAKWLNKHKILFAGIDIIGNKLTEINITSPTALRQIFAHAGIDIAKLVIESITPRD